MTYKVDLQVVTSGGQEIPADLKEYADHHGITYNIAQSGDDRSIVTFEAQDRESLENLIKDSYAPDNESERGQFLSQIQGEDTDGDNAPGADGESYLTYGTPEPRSDLDRNKPAPGQPDTQLEEAEAAKAGQDNQKVDQDKDEDQSQK